MYKLEVFTEVETNNVMEVFITNLGKYAEGELIGEWISLPITKEDLKRVKEKIGINDEYEEIFISDWITPFKMIDDMILNHSQYCEYSDINTLNEYAKKLSTIPKEDFNIVNAIMYDCNDFDEALNTYMNQEYFVYNGCHNMTDVAHEVVESGMFVYEVPNNLLNYIDYEYIGDVLDMEASFIQINNNTIIQINY